MVADAGVSARWSTAPALTARVTVLVLPASVPVTVCGPRRGRVHVAAVQEPLGAIVKVVVGRDVAQRVVVLSNASAV